MMSETKQVHEPDLSYVHEHICPDCGHYFECDLRPCFDFHKSCEPCVESDEYDAEPDIDDDFPMSLEYDDDDFFSEPFDRDYDF